MCPLYVAGLIGPGDRKSVEPMASRWAPGDYDQLHHFISSGVWEIRALLKEELAIQADKLIGGASAVLVVDDTALPKKGSHSVGVAPQYAAALGKTANCQTLVSLTLAQDEVPVMIGLRLFLPESWTGDADRMAKARVPETWRSARTKPEIALAEIDRIGAAGVRFATVLADAGYGRPRHSARARRARPEVGGRIPQAAESIRAMSGSCFRLPDGAPAQAPYPRSALRAGRRRSRHRKWRRVSWRKGTKAPLAASSPLCACGSPMVRHNASMTRACSTCRARRPGSSASGRASGERKYYLSNLPPDASLKTLAAAIKARWVCEQAHQQLKEELGLDHFEGRSWRGLHRHALMTRIAYAYLQTRRLAEAGGEKRIPRRATAADLASNTSSRDRNSLLARRPIDARTAGECSVGKSLQ